MITFLNWIKGLFKPLYRETLITQFNISNDKSYKTEIMIGMKKSKIRWKTDGYYFDGSQLWIIKKDDRGNTKMIKDLTAE